MRARTKTDSPFCAACGVLHKEKDSMFCRYHLQAEGRQKRNNVPNREQVYQEKKGEQE